ncbi:MAG: YigZ family protein [Candidatus Electryonea clarkiae]|nr:YigZ family protein [Candidatus Electryonea clarkiae]MDP8288169.1 YigZ family protein [Candidatus Electryonea clarkiae]
MESVSNRSGFILPYKFMGKIIDEYRTLAHEGLARLKVKGSIFQAIALPVKNSEDADSLLSDWRKSYHDATHIGWARRPGIPPEGEIRWSDDGEPSGTTGKPILQAITKADLWRVQIGVVRWFGGTKLGTGGLARAYGKAASDAVGNSKIIVVEIRKQLQVIIPNQYLGALYSIVEKLNAIPGPQEYDEHGMRIILNIRASMIDILANRITESTAGRAEVRILET